MYKPRLLDAHTLVNFCLRSQFKRGMLRSCVIGSGPAGYYTVQKLLKVRSQSIHVPRHVGPLFRLANRSYLTAIGQIAYIRVSSVLVDNSFI